MISSVEQSYIASLNMAFYMLLVLSIAFFKNLSYAQQTSFRSIFVKFQFKPSHLDCYEYAAMRFKSINRSLETCEHKPCFSTYTAHQAGRWHLSSRSIHSLLNTNILQIESCLLQTYTCFLKPQSFHLQAKLLSGLGYQWQSSIM